MLEVKNLSKAYKSKKGVVTQALDNVSLTFPEKGMVFILGKSGSGKSTLLNICGGLDKADSGEIIIKGKSSNEFSGQDFDSYRNTYVGFVFQEYNILDEFSVEENIGMALELQNKKRDKAIIDKILADVDMSSFASRKPNTLSGGQKQRVAIARALVKEPEIIMADEPTGALDSKTGQQVFDTLKHLSKDKLVIVISHDRDFAEQYADRIIELKDGKILSDQTRQEEDTNAKNVRYFGTDTVCVTNGAEITDEDLKNIKNFLQRSGGTAVISTSRTQIAQMKEGRPEINVGSFENIKEQPKAKAYENQKLIRSHLPVRHAVKMGANSLKTKPVRLLFTIFLSTIAFILFGLASTLMLYDKKSTTIQTFVDSDDEYMIISKGYYGRYTQYKNGEIEYQDNKEEKLETNFTIAEYKDFISKYPSALAVGKFSGQIENIHLGQYGDQYYSEYIRNAILVNDSIKMVYGVQPKASDEIAISDYLYNGIALPKTRFMDSKNKEIKISRPEDLIYSSTNPLTININYKEYKVVGIYEIAQPSSEFNDLKQAAEKNTQFIGNKEISEKWERYVEQSLLPSIMVTEDFLIKEVSSSNNSSISLEEYFKYTDGELKISTNTEEKWYSTIYAISTYNVEKGLPIYDMNGNLIQSLPERSVVLNANYLGGLYNYAYTQFIQQINSSYEEQEKIDKIYQELKVEFDETHLYNDKHFNSIQFEYDKEIWENAFEATKEEAVLAGVPFDEESYRNEHPYPQKRDQYEYGGDKYYFEDQEYWDELNLFRNEVYETSGTLETYKKLLYNAKMKADQEFRKNDPEPERPGEDATGAELDQYQEVYNAWNNRYWDYISEAQNAVNPLQKVSQLDNLNLEIEEVFALFKQIHELFKDIYTLNLGITNSFNPDFYPVTLQGIFFSDNLLSGCAYLSNDLYNTYYVSKGEENWYTSKYVSKYEESKDALIQSVYIPSEKTASFVEDIVQLTFNRGTDDSTILIQNSQMSQLDMFNSLVDTLGTSFLIAGIVLALFAFLLMFNFISVSISTKKKEIGILRAIGARTLDVYKIFMSEAFIIAGICLVVSIIGTFALCILLNNVLTSGTFIVISIFSFGPLSALCILGVALLTAIISTVIPVAIYARKPPIASIRAL